MKAIIAIFIAMMTWVPNCDTDGNNPTNSTRPGTTINNGGTYIPTGPSFNGWVIDDAKHKYVVGASICFEAFESCTKSNRNGIYGLWPPDTGTYTIVTTHVDYIPDTAVSWIGPDESTRLNIYLQPIGE